MSPAPSYTVVVPTIGRPSLAALLDSLAAQAEDPGHAAPAEVVLADDRRLDLSPGAAVPPPLEVPELPWPVRVVRTGGRGPAAARNAGWRVTTTEWVAFLDDDVLLPADWSRRLAADLAAADETGGGHRVGATQGHILVPLPTHRRPTDWERNTAGLTTALWATADMAYRREALAAVHGFDERFPRAYREDADLALRVRRAGWRLVRGGRTIIHPARPADWTVSLRMQAGARSDALMRALHGPAWREEAETGRGRFRWHLATVAAGVAAGLAAGLAAGITAAEAATSRATRGEEVVLRRNSGPRTTSPAQQHLSPHRFTAPAVAAAAWAALTADFARRRIAPGPRPGEEGWLAEWARMAVTSAAIPWLAVWHRARGERNYRHGVAPWPPPLRAVLLDRDGTLVHDVPYNADPDKVRLVDGAAQAVRRLCAAGLRTGLVTNQSGVARGLLTEDDVRAVNARLLDELGGLDTAQHCPHGPGDGCACRKPGPLMVLRAAAALGVAPYECAVVGDIGADVDAARAAGARSVLVPTPETRPEEVEQADVVAPGLSAAAELLLAMARGTHGDSALRGRPVHDGRGALDKSAPAAPDLAVSR
ncbi:HAD superfamily hydrolase (TIGR01509 family) [Georgenia soli]|uniref:D,D-heptose 1,7-bisphosphate phosphatase n=1 Tax=Georgenia soli TaxID=638953 RepID=A0A2A9ELI0_9MICO|nr:HAD-IIIA family hydrolase [Georgenia soli]PFG39947.1 HAD superfamily hydrolase (TIGR01509 family) [Georgenia soli]